MFNACIETMHLWRQMHGKRAELYLKPETPAAVQHYISTGLVVGLEDNRVQTLANVPRVGVAAPQDGRAFLAMSASRVVMARNDGSLLAWDAATGAPVALAT